MASPSNQTLEEQYKAAVLLFMKTPVGDYSTKKERLDKALNLQSRILRATGNERGTRVTEQICADVTVELKKGPTNE